MLQIDQGQSAIHHAIHSENLEMTKFLVSVGADVNVLDRTNRSPLSIATAKADEEIRLELIGAGALESNGRVGPAGSKSK